MAEAGPSGFSSSFNSPHTEPSLRQTASRKAAESTIGSPTGSTISSTPVRLPLRTNPDSMRGTPLKRTVIRADPTLITCFNPEDKELYNLWAPKQ